MSDPTSTVESGVGDTPAVPAKPVHPDMHWYVVHA